MCLYKIVLGVFNVRTETGVDKLAQDFLDAIATWGLPQIVSVLMPWEYIL